MELANIEKILEKYLNAETSLQEETTLKDYFAKDNIAPHLQEYQYMFHYFQTSKNETFTKTIQLKPKRKNYKWMSVAASIILLASIFIGNEQYKEYKIKKQYTEVENALKMLSLNIKKGSDAFENLYTYENTVNKIFKTK